MQFTSPPLSANPSRSDAIQQSCILKHPVSAGCFFLSLQQIFEKMGNRTEKCECIFLGSRTVSLSRSSGETLAVHSTESIFCKKMRGEKTALKSCSSLLALLSFPKLLPPLRFPQRLSFHYNHKKFLYGKMRMHFSRVKDDVLVAVQRRDAGRA